MKINLLYTLAFLCYGITFFLFIRLLYWKHVSRKEYWKHKQDITQHDISMIATFQDITLPYISLLIPAKNESAVIRHTIQNALQLDYPASRYEVVVITDARECKENEQMIDTIWKEVCIVKQRFMDGKNPDYESFTIANMGISNSFHRVILMHKMKHLLLGSFYSELSSKYASELSFEGDASILNSCKSVVDNTMKRTPTSQKELQRCLMESLRKEFPLTPASVLKKIMGDLENIISPWIRRVSIYEIRDISLEDVRASFSTTYSVSESMQTVAMQKGVKLKVLSVPENYTGEYPVQYAVEGTKSTKGRALNYALDKVHCESVMLGFYDAESRPDHSVLNHVAYRYLQEKEDLPILQGPLYQVRNYYKMGMISRIAGLFKAVSHEWYLPIIFKKLPFVGGTNLYIRKSLLQEVKGFNPDALTEDLEIGIRAYIQKGVTVEFLPVVSTEQTPPFWNQFFKQRLRWASGHLEVMSSIRKSHPNLYWDLFWKGPFEWFLYQFSGIVVIGMNLGFIASKIGWIPKQMYSVNPVLQIVLLCMNIPYVFFSFYCFYHYQFTFEKQFLSLDSFPGLECVKLLLSSLLVFLLPLPYIWAMILRAIGKHPTSWVKTPRTVE